MSSPLSTQASKVWQLLTASSTITTYKQAIDLTWLILKEIAHLLWLIVCLALVGWDWFWHKSIELGQNTRAWVDEFTATKPNSAASGNSAFQVWHNLLDSTKTASSSLLTKARQELNLSELAAPTAPAAPSSIAPAPTAPAPTAPSSIAPAPTAPAVPPASPTVTPPAPKSEATPASDETV